MIIDVLKILHILLTGRNIQYIGVFFQDREQTIPETFKIGVLVIVPGTGKFAVKSIGQLRQPLFC